MMFCEVLYIMEIDEHRVVFSSFSNSALRR